MLLILNVASIKIWIAILCNLIWPNVIRSNLLKGRVFRLRKKLSFEFETDLKDLGSILSQKFKVGEWFFYFGVTIWCDYYFSLTILKHLKSRHLKEKFTFWTQAQRCKKYFSNQQYQQIAFSNPISLIYLYIDIMAFYKASSISHSTCKSHIVLDSGQHVIVSDWIR